MENVFDRQILIEILIAFRIREVLEMGEHYMHLKLHSKTTILIQK